MAGEAEDLNRGVARTMRRILLFVLTILCILLFVLWRIDNPRVERLRMSLVDAIAPSMTWVGWPLEVISEAVSDYENFTRVYEQNAELRREIQRLRAWRDVAQQREQENARLRALNNVKLAPTQVFVTGEIMADSGGPFLQTGLANVGFRDGVTDGASVLDGSGLVGRVIALGRHSARILFVTDYSSRVPVVVRPSGQRAILSGDNTGAPRLDFVKTPDEVGLGDQIVTSGDGGVFPADLPVGVVTQAPNGHLRARLAADFARLDFVRVLRHEPDVEIDRPGGLVDRRDTPLGPAARPGDPVAEGLDQ